MTINALLLVLAASVLHAVWNYVSKRTNGGIPYLWLVASVSGLLYLPFVILLLLKNPGELSLITCLMSLVSAVIHLVYFVVLQTGYRKSDLSVVYPLARGSGPLLSSIGAVIFFGERPGLMASAGIIVIILGIQVIAGLNIRAGDRKRKLGIAYGIATGVFIALYTLWDKQSVSRYSISPLLLTFASTLLPILALAPSALRKPDEIKRELREHYRHILIVAILSPLSFILVLIALKTAPVYYIAPLREVSILFGVFLGARFLNEEDAGKRFIAAVIILAGIALLSLG